MVFQQWAALAGNCFSRQIFNMRPICKLCDVFFFVSFISFAWVIDFIYQASDLPRVLLYLFRNFRRCSESIFTLSLGADQVRPSCPFVCASNNIVIKSQSKHKDKPSKEMQLDGTMVEDDTKLLLTNGRPIYIPHLRSQVAQQDSIENEDRPRLLLIIYHNFCVVFGGLCSICIPFRSSESLPDFSALSF